jgi:formyltetrahydrofolate deformylase
MAQTVRLLIACPDARGIVAAVTSFLAEYDGNILDLDQHSDLEHNEFFMRVEVERRGFCLTSRTFPPVWQPIAQRFAMQWRAAWGERRRRMAVLVSRRTHCLSDLCWRWQNDELDADIPLIVSNHPDAAPIAQHAGLRYELCAVAPATRVEAEERLEGWLQQAEVDFVVLARYMQILSPAFVARWPNRLINIHHGFLPAFKGGSPYRQAYDRGVKMIGATSHYVTEVLDDGPIIAQDTAPTSHRDTVDDLVRKGRDLERIVLARAVRLHLEDRILVSNNKTVVFD